MTESIDVVALKYGTMQIVSAVDAVDRFDLRPDRTVLVTMPRLAATSCATEVPWSSVQAVDDRARGPRWWRRYRRYQRYLDAVREAVDGRAVDQLFIGLYGREMCAVANALRPRAVTVLDDGTSTVVRSKLRAADLRAGRKSAAHPTTQLVRRLVGLDARHLSHVRFFSMMEPELTDGDEFVQCDLASLASRIRQADVDPDVAWILGTNLVENGYLPSEVYASVVGGVARRQRSDNGRIVLEYHAHPGEQAEKLDTIANRHGVRIVRSSEPIELRVIDARVLPGAGVLSFPSTALISLRTLLPQDIPCSMVEIGTLASWTQLQVVEQSLIDELGERITVIDANEVV